MRYNRSFVEKLKKKLVDLTSICEFVEVFDGEYYGYFSREYGKLHTEQVRLPNPWVLVVKTKKSSIQFVAADGQLYWTHLSL
jgi:hypothetical protein